MWWCSGERIDVYVGDCSLDEGSLEQFVEGRGGDEAPFGGTGTRWNGDKCADGSCVGCGREMSELLVGGCHGEQAVC